MSWNVPAAQSAHVLCPVMEANVPGSQLVQVVAPDIELKVPALQAVHGSLPSRLELPATQGCADAGVAIAPVTTRTTSARSVRSEDRSANISSPLNAAVACIRSIGERSADRSSYGSTS